MRVLKETKVPRERKESPVQRVHLELMVNLSREKWECLVFPEPLV